MGRDSEVQQVQNYIDGDSDRPLVMVGFPGSGKSSMAAYMVKKCLQNPKYKVSLSFYKQEQFIIEPHHEKTNILYMQKQRRRSALQ